MAMLTLSGCASFSALGKQSDNLADASDNDAESMDVVYAAADVLSDIVEGSETETETETETEQQDVERITLAESTLELTKGEEYTLDVSVYPLGSGKGRRIIWSSLNPKVVRVENGCITAVGAGTTKVYASIGGVSTSCTVTVTVPLEGISVEDMEIENDHQITYYLDVQLIPEDTTDDVTITYTSSDTSVLGIDPMGGIHTGNPGTTEITVTAGDIEETCTVTVTAPLKKLVFDEDEISINVGESAQLGVTPSPKNTTDDVNLKYKSSDESVVSVDADGVITALSAGSAKITVSSGSVSAVCSVKVCIPVEGIELSSHSLQLEKGTSQKLSAKLLPEDTTESPTVTYSSSNASVAAVDENGTVTAVGAGSAVITASCEGFADSCSVNVTAALTSIALNKTDITIYTGGSASLSVSYAPEDTTDDRTVTWTSSNTGVATVSGGTVVAVSEGTCTVTATVGACSASCIVRVKTLASTTTTTTTTTTTASSSTSTSGKVIVLDPGHGGIDPGASSGSLVEKDMTLKVALYCKEYLEANYTGMTVLLTRSTDTQLAHDETGTDLRARCEYAASVGADIMVSLHFNSTDTHTSQGALVIVSKQSNVNSACTTLANSILAQLTSLGLGNRGLLLRDSTTLFDSNGVALDYYAINRICASYGIPGVIVEHCFMDNAGDAAFCDSDEDLRQLGIADAIGIANALGLAAK